MKIKTILSAIITSIMPLRAHPSKNVKREVAYLSRSSLDELGFEINCLHRGGSNAGIMTDECKQFSQKDAKAMKIFRKPLKQVAVWPKR